MSASLKDRLQNDVKDAMRARAKQTLGTLRLIMAELKRREVDERIELSDQDVLLILEKMVKKRMRRGGGVGEICETAWREKEEWEREMGRL